MSTIQKTKFIKYNSVISLSLVSDNTDKRNIHYILRDESLEESIELRKFNVLSDFCLLKESLFVILHPKDTQSEESYSADMTQNEDLKYNVNFILQHMVSKKFLSKEKVTGSNSYTLKLVDQQSLAIPFCFKKIIDSRSGQNEVQFNEILYLSAFIKEKMQYFYVNEEKSVSGLINRDDTTDILKIKIEKDFSNKFLVINQSCFGQDDGYLYSGDLINIEFKFKDSSNIDKQYMLGVECSERDLGKELIPLKEEQKEKLDNFEKENLHEGNDINDVKYERKYDIKNEVVKSFKIKDKLLYKHISHNSFWIIEEENYSNNSKTLRRPLKAESHVKLKNPLLNLYLKIKLKQPKENEYANEGKDYEFELVPERNSKDEILNSNFQIFHYSINVENKNLINNGKYILKAKFEDKVSNLKDDNNEIDITNYFESVALQQASGDNIVVSKRDEFVFELKKIDIYKGNEVIYLKNIIDGLSFQMKNFQSKTVNTSFEIDVISKHLTFFTNYLINLDYSFMDLNLEKNYPVPERQNLLKKFGILEIINTIITNLQNNISNKTTIKKNEDSELDISIDDKVNKKNEDDETRARDYKDLMKKILNFLTYLCQDNEKIKFLIYANLLNLLSLGEVVFKEDKSLLLDFIFIIIKGSSLLQEVVLDKSDKFTKTLNDKVYKKIKKEINDDKLIKLDKIFEYIKTTKNYLDFYKRILNLDKVPHKKEEIYNRITEHQKAVEDEYEADKFKEEEYRKQNYLYLKEKTINKIRQGLDMKENKHNNDPNDVGKTVTSEIETELKNKEKIRNFLDFFEHLKLNDSLFLNEIFLQRLSNCKGKVISDLSLYNKDNIDYKLMFIINNKIDSKKFLGKLDVILDSQLGSLFPLQFYNEIFPQINELNKQKNQEMFELEKQEIQGGADINENTNKNKNLNISTLPANPHFRQASDIHSNQNTLKDNKAVKIQKSKTVMFKHIKIEKQDSENIMKTINNELCTLYSMYQFCINQYFEAILSVYERLKNICVNYQDFINIQKTKKYLNTIISDLLNKIIFLNPKSNENDKTNIDRHYENVKKSVSILSNTFDDENLNDGKEPMFSNDEMYLIKSTFEFCQLKDTLDNFFDKTTLYIKIRKLLDKNDNDANVVNKDMNDNILSEINIKRKDYLSKYQSLIQKKEKLIKNNKFRADSIKAYTVQKQIQYVTNLLGKCELEEYFNRIIYINSNEKLDSLNKFSAFFKKIKESIESVHNEKNINKDDYNKDDTNILEGREKYRNKAYTTIEMIIDNLNKVSTLFSQIFGDNNYVSEEGTTSYIERILMNEESSYLSKINFNEEFIKIITALDNIELEGEKNFLKVKYNRCVLKVFNNITMNDKYGNFHKLIANDMDKYFKFVENSLNNVKNVLNSSESDAFKGEKKKEVLILIFNAAKAFLYLVKHSKSPFSELRREMNNIFGEFLLLYETIYSKNPKRNKGDDFFFKIDYQIFYTFLVSRVLLHLNKKKAYDYYHYEMFYRNIYPVNEMKKRINISLAQLKNNGYESNDVDKKTESKISEKSDQSMSQNEEIEDNKNNINDDLDDDFVGSEDSFIEEKEEKNLILNLLTIYTIYLNELNTVRTSSGKSAESNTIENFKFNTFYSKFSDFLDPHKSFKNLSNNNNFGKQGETTNVDYKTMLTSTFKLGKQHQTGITAQPEYSMHQSMNESFSSMNGHLIKGQKNVQELDADVDNNFEFESILLESIIHYKLMNKNLEIGIKQQNNKKKFYYYDTVFIDILLSEKILLDIDIIGKIKEYFYEKEKYNPNIVNINDEKFKVANSDLVSLEKLKTLKHEYLKLMSYDQQEVVFKDLLHDQYIKDNMLQFIKNVIKTFGDNDYNSIEAMKYFNFIMMYQMYPDRVEGKRNNDKEQRSFLQTLINLDEGNITVKVHLQKDKPSNESTDNRNNNPLQKYNSQVDLNKIFSSIMYLYPQYSKDLTILIYKNSFNLLFRECKDFFTNNNNTLERIDFEEVINSLSDLFNREINKDIILNKTLFFTVLDAIKKFLKVLKTYKRQFVIKNPELMQKLFGHFIFIFNHLEDQLKKIVEFLKSPESQKISDKYFKKEEKLIKIISFIKSMFKFNAQKDFNCGTKEIRIFNTKIVEQIIKLIFILLEFNNKAAHKTILTLLDFIDKFIQGPDIESIQLLFNEDYFELMKYAIRKIDYYQILLENINGNDLHERVDTMINIENKIMKIFFVYFNIAYNSKKDLSHLGKVRKFYEENFKAIEDKLKRIFYISQKELEDKKFDIDQMILNKSPYDNYSLEELHLRQGGTEANTEIFKEWDKENRNKNNTKKNKYCVIKFEIILIYYTLYIFQREVMTENYFNIQTSNEGFLYSTKSFFYSVQSFFIAIAMLFFNIGKFIYEKINGIKKDKRMLFEKLYDIDQKYTDVKENDILNYMKTNISSVEITLNDTVYKVFFPVLTKNKKIIENPAMFIKVDSDKLQDYTYHILNNYDNINIVSSQNRKVDMILDSPIVNIIFLNMNMFNVLSLIFALIINLLIMLSYSDTNASYFLTHTVDRCKNAEDGRKLCPCLMYDCEKITPEKTDHIFNIFGIIQIMFTIILFIDFFLRKFFTQLKVVEFNYENQKIKSREKPDLNSFFVYISNIFIPTVFHSLLSFKTVFYFGLLASSFLGIMLHNFFFCFMLAILVERIDVMKNVVLAMYVPRKQMSIALLIFLVLIYYFALFAISFFPSHFPISEDVTKFWKTFMRVLDQTFKQDGGVGTYLDQSLEEGYVPYVPKAYCGLRFWYDNLFTYIILILIFQMFLSIIKDYFTSQREEIDDFISTKETKCLICNLEREVIEKTYMSHKNAFDIHINHDHNATNYICYLSYLQFLDKRDGIVEENVWQMHLRNNYFFLPKSTCFKLKAKKNLENKNDDSSDDDEDDKNSTENDN